jgi:hypothetical protein
LKCLGKSIVVNGGENAKTFKNDDAKVERAPFASMPGSQLFQNPSGNAFTALENLNTALLANNPASVGAAVQQLQDALNTLSAQRVFYGNGLNQINLSESRQSRQDQPQLAGKRACRNRSRRCRVPSRPGPSGKAVGA